MNAEVMTSTTMHADHRHWLAAHAQWQQEIARWQAEHETAVERLAKLQDVVRLHGECLEQHARAFRESEQAIAAHERELQEYQAGANKQPHDVMATRHQAEAEAFRRQQDAQQRIRTHHEAVMAQLFALELTASTAM